MTNKKKGDGADKSLEELADNIDKKPAKPRPKSPPPKPKK